LALNGVENVEVFVQLFGDVEDGSYVAAAIAVVWRRPNGN